jgi:hypothetical protein
MYNPLDICTREKTSPPSNSSKPPILILLGGIIVHINYFAGMEGQVVGMLD